MPDAYGYVPQFPHASCAVFDNAPCLTVYIQIASDKGNTAPVQAVKAYSGSRGISPIISNLDARLRWVVIFTPRPLSPYK